MTSRLAALGVRDLLGIVELNRQVMLDMPDEDWLRDNDEAMFADCLATGEVLGAHHGEQLTGVGVLVRPGSGPESIQRYLTDDRSVLDASYNVKLVLVSPAARGSGLGYHLVESLVYLAAQEGAAHVLCTIHPKNQTSERLFTRVGFSHRALVQTSYGHRNIFELSL